MKLLFYGIGLFYRAMLWRDSVQLKVEEVLSLRHRMNNNAKLYCKCAFFLRSKFYFYFFSSKIIYHSLKQCLLQHYFFNDLNSRFSIFQSIQYIKNLVRPTGNKINIIFPDIQWLFSVTCQVENI